MTVRATTRVGELLDAHPEALDVLEMYGVAVEEADEDAVLDDFCAGNGIDVDDLMVDLGYAGDFDDDATSPW